MEKVIVNIGEEDSDKYFVYKHKNKINGKCYIGITCAKNPNNRWSNGLGYKSQIFYRAIQKYGWNNFEHIILYENLSKKQAVEQEIKLIREYKAGGLCYNITDGGEGSKGVAMPQTTKEALRKANTGRICSEETKKKISESEKGKKCSEKNKQLYRDLYTGKSLSEEHKEKIKRNNKKAKAVILVDLQTKEEIEFSSGRQASLWLGLSEDAVTKAISKGHLLKNKRYKAYRNEASKS